MCGFIAHSSVGRASHGIAEVVGSNPVEALIFFRLRLPLQPVMFICTRQCRFSSRLRKNIGSSKISCKIEV